MMKLFSRPSDLHDDDSLDQTIRLFRAALLVENRGDTHRYLSAVYTQKRDFRQAIQEISDAITLQPDSPENYHIRSLLWRITGDYVQATLDYHQCLELDPHYGNIENIRLAADRVKTAVTDLTFGDWCATAKTATPELRTLLDGIAARFESLERFFARPSCSLPCPAYCCYFEYEMFEHEVIIEEEQLENLKVFLAGNRLKEKEYIGKSRRKVDHNGMQTQVYHPKRSKKLVDRDLLPALPRNLGYNKIIWASEKARACKFLTEKGCLIHEVGEKPGLNACRQFMCLTGFIFLLLRYLGLYTDSMVDMKDLAELNLLAPDILLCIDRHIYGNRGLADRELSLHATLTKVIEVEAAGHRGILPEEVRKCLELEEDYRKLHKAAAAALREDLLSIFAPSHGKPAFP